MFCQKMLYFQVPKYNLNDFFLQTEGFHFAGAVAKRALLSEVHNYFVFFLQYLFHFNRTVNGIC